MLQQLTNVVQTSLFPLGGYLLIAKDFKGPDYSNDEVRMGFLEKVKETGNDIVAPMSKLLHHIRQRCRDSRPTGELQETPGGDLEAARSLEKNDCQPPLPVRPTRQVSFAVGRAPPSTTDESNDGYGDLSPTGVAESTESSRDDDRVTQDATTMVGSQANPSRPPSPYPSKAPRRRTCPRRLLSILKSFCTPPAISIITSFPIAVVPPLKALFVPTGSGPQGPDGLPPLSFILDTASFIGAASVPLGLICLGSALGRLKIPRPWTHLPLGAIGMFSIAKLFVLPVLGVLTCRLFTYTIPLIDVDDKVLRYVCM